MPGPLSGVRVLELTSIILGPWGAQLLGDMGADVIKVESPDGDPMRDVGPRQNPGMAAVYLNVNRNKRSLVLDLKQAPARDALLRLVEGSDVFLHALRPPAIARLGLAYEDLAPLNERLIYCGTHGYSKKGPYGDRGAYDDLIQGGSGLSALLGRATGTPAYMPTVMADKTSSMAVALAISMALFAREKSGRGQEVEVPMFETMVAFTMIEHLFGETFVPALGPAGYPRTLSPHRAPYETKDGHIGVLPYNDRQWRSFFEVVGRTDMAGDERYATMASRLENIDSIYSELRTAMATRSTADWLTDLVAANVPATAINDLDDLFEDEHLKAIDFWRTFEHPTEGTLRMPDVFTHFSETPGGLHRGPPRHGEHTAEVLAEGGLSGAEIAALCDSGAAIQAPPHEQE